MGANEKRNAGLILAQRTRKEKRQLQLRVQSGALPVAEALQSIWVANAKVVEVLSWAMPYADGVELLAHHEIRPQRRICTIDDTALTSLISALEATK